MHRSLRAMWNLSPLQLLLALGLDIALGDPRWMPRLRSFVRGMIRRMESIAGGCFGQSLLAGIVLWLFVAALLVCSLGLLRFLLQPLPILYGCAEVFIASQCLAVSDISRRTKAILQPLRQGDLQAAGFALTGRPATLSESEISAAAIERIATECRDRFLAPLFWVVVAGPVGALLHFITSELANQPRVQGRFSVVWQGIDSALGFVPARLLALMSETFRKFRSVGKIRRESRNAPGLNNGWSEAALAYDLDVRLGQPPTVYNASGNPPGASDVAEARTWFWRIVSFTTVLSLLALR